jgi:hypothetical protein
VDLHITINKVVKGDKDYLFTGIDSRNAMIDQRFMKASKHGLKEEVG